MKKFDIINFQDKSISRSFEVSLLKHIDYQDFINQISSYKKDADKKSPFRFVKLKKNRSEVSGTSKKAYKQKHTGKARTGNQKSQVNRGGGIAFASRGLKSFIKINNKYSDKIKKTIFSYFAENNKLIFLNNTNFEAISKLQIFKSHISNIIGNSDNLNILIISPNNLSSFNIYKNNKYLSFKNLTNLTINKMIVSDYIMIDSILVDKIF